MSVQESRIPMSEQEQQALEALLAAHPGKPVSLTRRDPNEAGPLLVHVGDETFELPSG
jgi:hypothetical protein